MGTIGKLTRLFVIWKSILISLLFLVPKQYDTSSQLIFPEIENSGLLWHCIQHIIERLVIWDSVFFVTVADRGMLYEHEWAFGKFWYKIIELLGELQPGWWQLSKRHWIGGASICLSIMNHYLSVLLLYKLTKMIFPGKKRMARATASLYILSPAGIFLIAGYSESTFALLSLIGMYLRERKLWVFSGMVFAISCGIRGNGVLWGLVFLYDLVDYAAHKVNEQKNWCKSIISILIGGSFIGITVLGLQILPFLTYCPERGEWCNNMIPSIFGYVQSKYWGVGFLRYWTPNNIPNFLFGAPTLVMLYLSFRYYWNKYQQIRPYLMVQLLILIMAVFIYHVQIITRIATCLPPMYWFAGEMISSTNLTEIKIGTRFKTYCICWGVAHGILFAAFLPPA